MSLFFIILTVLLACAMCFGIGQSAEFLSNLRTFNELMNIGETEEEKSNNDFRTNLIRSDVKRTILFGILAFAINASVFALNLWDYRNAVITDYKKGKIVCTENIKTKVKNGEIIGTDTLYVYQRVKPEKK